jgi:hypothetical protein
LATQAVEPVPAQARKGAAKQPLHYRLMLTTYRIFAVTVLYLVLIGVVSYAFVMGFYAVNTSWAAPVILSATDEKSLDFREKLVTSQQSIEDLKVDTNKLEKGLEEMRAHRASLVPLEPQLQEAIVREKAHDRATGPQLAALDKQKLADNKTTQALMDQLNSTRADIQKDLAAGLITRDDATSELAALNQTQDGLTDSKIAEVLLTDSVLDKTNIDTNALDVLVKQSELRSEASQLDVAIQVADKQLTEETRQIQRLHDAIQTAKQSPYYLNAQGRERINFAFVPYDNQASATPGSDIYDCYLNMIVCRKVGTVKQIFPGEQQATHPIFKTQIRGFLIEMDLDHPQSAMSKTLFMGGKPLLF